MSKHSVFRAIFLILLGAFIVLALIGPAVVSTRSSAALATVQQQEMQRFFRKYHIAQLEPEKIAEDVRQSGKFSIATSARMFDLDLTQNDLRAQGYHAEEVVDSGLTRELPASPVRTYKGTVAGERKSDARLTIDDQALEGMMITSEGWYIVEWAQKYNSTAKTTDYVVYEASDVLAQAPLSCGVTLK